MLPDVSDIDDAELIHHAMTTTIRRAIWFLGGGQCVYWGMLYYGFSVLLEPMAHELETSRRTVAGAFSVGLLVMGLAAPQIGRWVDRDRAARVMRSGAWIAVLGLVAASQVTNVYELYAVWAVLGLAMASLFYEPVFGLVIRTVANDTERLRALASVTVIAGLASTIFLPVMAFLVKHLAWRRTELVVAGSFVVTSFCLQRYVLPVMQPSAPSAPSGSAASATTPPPIRVHHPGTFTVLAVAFVLSTLGGMSLTTILIPVLVDRGRSATTAATVLAALGVMQLPGRIWLLRGGRAKSIRGLLALQLALQSLGMLLVAAGGWLAVTVAGVACFGVGAGLHTLARPWALQSIYGVAGSGRANGVMARYEGFARAIGPVLIASLYDYHDAITIFGGLSLALVTMGPITWLFVLRRRNAPPEQTT